MVGSKVGALVVASLAWRSDAGSMCAHNSPGLVAAPLDGPAVRVVMRGRALFVVGWRCTVLGATRRVQSFRVLSGLRVQLVHVVDLANDWPRCRRYGTWTLGVFRAHDRPPSLFAVPWCCILESLWYVSRSYPVARPGRISVRSR